MSSGFNEPDFDSAAEVKDRTLWWWAAVGILVIAFLGALFIWGRSDPNVSRVRARHILISFDQNDPANRGGDLNFQEKGSLEQAVEDFVWTAPIGQVSEVVQTKYGFHIIRVEDRYLSEADKYDLEMKRRAMEGETAGGQ